MLGERDEDETYTGSYFEIDSTRTPTVGEEIAGKVRDRRG